MNQLQIFKKTITHEQHDQYLFYANFTPDLEKRIRFQLQLDESIELRKYFGMYAPVEPEVPVDNVFAFIEMCGGKI